MEMMKLLEMGALAEVISKYSDEYKVRAELLKNKYSDNIFKNNEVLAEIIVINSLLETLLDLQEVLKGELGIEEDA